MEEHPGLVTMKGNPITLLGPQLAVGDPAPEFRAVATDLTVVDFSSHKGKVVVLMSVPSLDTPVCEIETQRFNMELDKLGEDVVGIAISMDLPFAQKRWCAAHGVERVLTLSDHREASFGEAYGVLIKDLRLLARAVFVVDREGVVQYKELIKEVSSEPDYDAALEAVRKQLG